MVYRNENTGFVLETNSIIKAEGWVELGPQPKLEKKKETKPKRTIKREK